MPRRGKAGRPLGGRAACVKDEARGKGASAIPGWWDGDIGIRSKALMKVASESWAHAVGAKLRYCGRMIDAGPIVDAASFGADLRKRISMRRRCGTSSGNPEIASVSSVFTNCAPDNGINLYPASKGLWRRTLTTATARASPSPALSTGIRLPMLGGFLRTDAKSRSRLEYGRAPIGRSSVWPTTSMTSTSYFWMYLRISNGV